MQTCPQCGGTFNCDHTWFLQHVDACRITALAIVKDPLAKAVTKAYRDSDLFKLEKLFAEESRWKRKVTIATNKLSEVREQINKLSREMATPKPETKSAE